MAEQEITPEGSVSPVFLDETTAPSDAAEIPAPSVSDQRLAAYRLRSDPLFFKAHAGELGTVDDGLTLWQNERDAIRAEIPESS